MNWRNRAAALLVSLVVLASSVTAAEALEAGFVLLPEAPEFRQEEAVPAPAFPEAEDEKKSEIVKKPKDTTQPESVIRPENAERMEDSNKSAHVDRLADFETELILVDGQQAVYSDVQDEEYHIRELEGRVVAKRIRE